MGGLSSTIAHYRVGREAELEAEWTLRVSSGVADLAEERRLLDCAAKLEFHKARMLHVAFGARGLG